MVKMTTNELALAQEDLEETLNKGWCAPYADALNRRDAEAIHKILAADLEWWFHGPPSHQFLMRLLTRRTGIHLPASCPTVSPPLAPPCSPEGFDQSRSIAWFTPGPSQMG
ncbi:hypothetical protein DH2020_044272 [Rehmannia glutinosa]|uniref:Uncharacterized protein n=1 Tax=Rehmannia glutinosa TaxID=99300 RepID=A0ABR0UI75_REHGL